jgi:hypothetical protein
MTEPRHLLASVRRAIAQRTGIRERLRTLGIRQQLRVEDITEEQLWRIIEIDLPGARAMPIEEIQRRSGISNAENDRLDLLTDGELLEQLTNELTDKQLIDIFGDQEMQNPGSVIGKPEPELTDDSQK